MSQPSQMNWRMKLLAKWGAFCHDNAWLLVIVIVAISLFFAYFAMTIELNLGYLALLDDREPVVQRVNDANENFGGLDYLTIALVTPRDQPPDKERLIRYASKLAPKIRDHPELVSRLVEKVDLDQMIRWAPLFLDDKDLDDFIDESTKRKDDLARVFRDLHLPRFLTEFNRIIENEIIEEDEIADEKEALDQLRSLDKFFTTAQSFLTSEEEWDAGSVKRSIHRLMLPAGDEDDFPEDDYFLFDGGRMLILRLMSVDPDIDYEYCRQVLTMIENVAAEVSQEVPGVQMLLAGNIPVMHDEYNALVFDVQLATVLSMIAVLLIFVFVFRKFTDLLLIGLCLLSGLAITFGLTQFVIGYLSLLTAFFGSIMIGLGIDFAIHFISRYGENIRRGETVRQSVINSMAGAGPGIITGGATTAAAFLVLMIARFKGLSELGFVSGVGILVMLALMFSLLPAMVCLRDRRKVAAELTIKSIGDSIPLGRLADFAVHSPRLSGIFIVLISAAALYGTLHTSFNYDYRSLEPRNSIAIKHIEEVEARLGKGIDYGLFIADSVEKSRQLTNQAKKLSTVEDAESIADFIPENQADKNERIKSLAPVFNAIQVENRPAGETPFSGDELAAYAEAVRGSARVTRAVLQLAILGGHFELIDLARAVAERLDAFAALLTAEQPPQFAARAGRYQRIVADEMNHLLASLQLATKGEQLTVDALPEAIRENYIGKDGRMVVYTYPNGNIWNELFMRKHNAELYSLDQSAISIPILFERVVDSIKVDFRSSIWFSLAAVCLLVLLDFRRPLTALLAMIPLLVGSLWMVGIMPLLGMQFNLVNVAIVPLILGIGIDNGVHILHRYRMEKSRRVHFAVEHTGKAILLSALTTMAGFGMLGLATYVAIGTLGQLLLVGVGFCFFTSVFVLPLILAIFEKNDWKV
ncbi:MAG TPA: MMPL family transporter [bacterium]|nr:MMPL family transporter [bacterium]